MPGPSDLCRVAAAGTFRPNNKYVNVEVCHGAVLDWLIQAGFADGKRVDDLLIKEGTRPLHFLCERILARLSDARVTLADAGMMLSKGGKLVGFYDHGVLQHSMVCVAPLLLAGVRNLYVGGSLGFTVMPVRQLLWDNGGQTVGPAHCEVHVVDVEEFPKRLAVEP
jgi:hypothetical protein